LNDIKIKEDKDIFMIIKELPLELLSKIFQFYIFPYDFDKDMVNFYISNYMHVINGNLHSTISCWFGMKNPKNNEEYFLHTDFERPYPLELERQFSHIANKIYNDNKKFKFRDSVNKDYKFSGTYGPLKNNSCKDSNFIKTGHASFNYNTADLSEYFNEMDIDNNEIVLSDAIEVESNNKLNIYTAIDRLNNIISVNIKNTIDEFAKESKNIINGPLSKIEEWKRHCEPRNNKFSTMRMKQFYNFYKICKKVPDNYILLNLNILGEIKKR
jgi:hypothetical protein